MTNDDEPHSMGGVFDTWGITFLDDFNESINGEDSTTPFNIWYDSALDGDLMAPEYLEYFIFDFAYDLTGVFGGVIYTAIVAFNIYLMIKRERKSNIIEA